jgi:phenylpyruvate tautomerase PptA (4-oxalocrotonate tautomerase family)
MPLYICSAPADALDDERRRRLAEAITRIHCEVTGAPAMFVHVIFDASQDRQVSVFGTIRAGRSEETKTLLKSRLAQAVAEAAAIDAAKVGVVTSDVPASWVMEGGAVLPEPGEEEAWLSAHADPPEGAR